MIKRSSLDSKLLYENELEHMDDHTMANIIITKFNDSIFNGSSADAIKHWDR